jgi:hypothetical protein
MTDILQDMADIIADIDNGDVDSDTFDISSIYILLSRAVGEIERLRKANNNSSWELNPDRMGGQFTQDEIDRARRGGEGW